MGYDHVLLESYLVPYLFEKGHRPKMEKRGNKVIVIQTREHIAFRDVTKLLAPSTNLRSFGQLFNLEQKKAHFPFRFLDSVHKLSEPELPADLEMWRSDLTGPSISIDDIAQARALFREANCTSVGDYLRTYLRLDIVILQRATQAWRRNLNQLIDVDFVVSKKFTISSLSYLAGGKSLVKQRGLGNFFPNNAQTYRILREGMRGYVE